MFEFELNHSFTELHLILHLDDIKSTFIPFQRISLGNEMPIIFDNKIRQAKWSHIFNNNLIYYDKIDLNAFQRDYFRCVVPIDGFFYIDQFSHTTHFYTKSKSLFFAVAICDKNNNFDFVMVKNENMFFPVAPLSLSIKNVSLWFGPSFNTIPINDQITIDDFEFMEVVQQEGLSPVCFTITHDQIEESRITLNKELKNITPKINQLL